MNIQGIGIIQGRLTYSGGVIQKFPDDTWKEEFGVAKELGLAAIELIVDRTPNPKNPLWNGDEEGLIFLARVNQEVGVSASSVTLDNVIGFPLVPEDGIHRANLEQLVLILRRLSRIGVKSVVFPFLEEASVRDDKKRKIMVELFEQELAPLAKELGMRFLIEDDLPVPTLKEVLQSCPSIAGVCYDTGNRTGLGFDAPREILELGAAVRHVHIKDKKDGKNVMLGTGVVDFKKVTESLRTIDYNGMLILETCRGNEEKEAARQNLGFIKKHLYK